MSDTDQHCTECGHPLWAPQSQARGYCEACHIRMKREQLTKENHV